jgi:hypothetical protein
MTDDKFSCLVVPSEAELAGRVMELQMANRSSCHRPTNASRRAAIALAVSLPGSRDTPMEETEGTTEKRSRGCSTQRESSESCRKR